MACVGYCSVCGCLHLFSVCFCAVYGIVLLLIFCYSTEFFACSVMSNIAFCSHCASNLLTQHNTPSLVISLVLLISFSPLNISAMISSSNMNCSFNLFFLITAFVCFYSEVDHPFSGIFFLLSYQHAILQ